LQTFVEQEFDFLLREYLGLPVSLYFHAWCILDPILESLPHLLRYCIGRRGFFNVVARGAKGNKGHRRFGEGQSLSGILKINDVGKFIGLQRSNDCSRSPETRVPPTSKRRRKLIVLPIKIS
jgi:hypothetical protein